MGLILCNQEEIKSRYDYNKSVFKYDSMFAENPLEIIIETSYYQAVYPVEKHSVGSFVGKFCEERGICSMRLQASKYEGQRFEIFI